MSDDANGGADGGKGMNRRDALKLLGVVPLSGMLHWTPVELDRAVSHMQHAEAAAPDAKLKFFSAHEYSTVHVLADMIIPRDERSGSASDARVPQFMDYMLAEASERNRTEMHGGLAWLDTASRNRFGSAFVDCTPAQRESLLNEIAWPGRARPELSQGVAFFNSFRDLTASGFFSSEMGYKDVQYKGAVFNPNWDGCPPAALAQLGVSYDAAPSPRTPRTQE